MSTNYFLVTLILSSDDNDASKKYKNNFNLSDAVGKLMGDNLIMIEITWQKMMKDKKDDIEKKIPPKFG